MKYSVLALVSFFLLGCKSQQLTFKQADMQKGISGVQDGVTTYTFTLITPAKEKVIGDFTKLWFNEICYEVNKQSITEEQNETKIVLFTQDPPRGFRSSKSPISLSEEVKLVIEHVKGEKIEHLAVSKVNIEKTISYPSAPPRN